jgi:hypothetical protein
MSLYLLLPHDLLLLPAFLLAPLLHRFLTLCLARPAGFAVLNKLQIAFLY